KPPRKVIGARVDVQEFQGLSLAVELVSDIVVVQRTGYRQYGSGVREAIEAARHLGGVVVGNGKLPGSAGRVGPRIKYLGGIGVDGVGNAVVQVGDGEVDAPVLKCPGGVADELRQVTIAAQVFRQGHVATAFGNAEAYRRLGVYE